MRITGVRAAFCWFMVVPLSAPAERQARIDDVVLRFDSYDGPAKIFGEIVDKHRLRVDVDPRNEASSLLIYIELPKTGRNAWPVADIEVRDGRGEAIVVTRNGLQWHKLLISVPAVTASYFVQAIEPQMNPLQLTAREERQLVHTESGLTVALAHWHNGRRAALSLRFDDSHPTHLSKVVPLLDKYGFRGTFMINPGPDEPGSRRRSAFQRHRAQWEAVAKSGAHEFANHSAHHRGAKSDAEMDEEIGQAARAIWKMTQVNSRLTALNLGGGTQWSTTRTLRHYLDKYQHFDASSGSLGMDDTYGDRVNAFREHVRRHIKSRGWCRAHFHYIGEGLSTSEANFRAVLEVVRDHTALLWIAGMSDIQKYQTERNTASLSLVESTDHYLTFRLSCQTDPNLYDQSLTVQVKLPAYRRAAQLRVRDSQGKAIAVSDTLIEGQTVLQFEVPPHTAQYSIEWSDINPDDRVHHR